MDLLDSDAVTSGSAPLVIKKSPEAHCWVQLPQNFVNRFLTDGVTTPVPVRLRRHSASNGAAQYVLVAWNGLSGRQNGAVEVPTALASALRLHDGESVTVELAQGLPTATLVHFTAKSMDDWEVIEPNGEYLHTAVLQQLKVVRKGDTMPLWVREQSFVYVKVDSATPADEVVLQNGTIVSIQPPSGDPGFSASSRTSQALDAPISSILNDVQSDDSDNLEAAPIAAPIAGSSLKSIDLPKIKRPKLTGNLRLRVRSWPDHAFDMKLSKAAGKAVRTVFGTGIFVSPDLAEATNIAMPGGKLFAVLRAPDADVSSCSVVPVYPHADVSQGHVCMAECVMRSLALTENSQVWLKADFSSKAPFARVSKITFSRMREVFAQPAGGEEDEGDDQDGGAAGTAPGGAGGEDDEEDDDARAFVRTCDNHDCNEVLHAATTTGVGAALRPMLQQGEHGKDSLAFNPLRSRPSSKSGAVPAKPSETLQLSLRALLKDWVRAHIDYLASVQARLPAKASSGSNEISVPASASKVESIHIPRASVLCLTLDNSAQAPAPAWFLLTCQLSASFYRTVTTKPSDIDSAGPDLVISPSAPVPCPIANLLAAKPSISRDIFWRAMPHNRTAVPSQRDAASSVLPDGKGWLGKELRQALAIALPYLSVQTQSFWKRSTVPPPGGILVSGMRGCGKTALLERCAAYLQDHPSTMCHVSRMQCRNMAGDKMKKIAKWLQSVLLTSLTHAPAVVLLDDVDALIPVVPEHAPPQEQHMIEAVAEFLANVFDWVREKVSETGAQVLVIASCTDAGKLPKLLRCTGRLDHFIEVGTPSTSERSGMLEHMLRLREVAYEMADIEHLARKTEGFDAMDMQVLIERAIQHVRLTAVMQGRTTPSKVAAEHWEAALKDFEPSAAWEAGAKETSDESVKGWTDVGGMKEAKEALYEAIELPLRFAKLVAKAPLRLRTGVLLYGPPGCGKTHAVRAAVAAAGVRFIGVKGPEMLNKYIGASEEAVRNVFARAQAAAPCVLFFDEFDSIAPQRGSGSDSTGVTERMVNQLLTELDGVEKLQGVCVIAASNRPDLIDVALLRPGRLDRLIYCGFPGQEEREAILQALFHKVKVEDGLDVKGLAAETEGFSGADLQAIVSESQLAAVMRHLEMLKASEAASGKHSKHAEHETPSVQVQDVESAMRNARPSLSSRDRAELDNRYRKFMKAREGNSQSPFSKDVEAAQRELVNNANKMRVAMG